MAESRKRLGQLFIEAGKIDKYKLEEALEYKKETMVGDVQVINNNLDLSITINDTVHYEKNIFLRKISIKNMSKKNREMRIFAHQHFTISEAKIGDTVYYNPLVKSIIHYKGKRYFLINGYVKGEKNKGIYSYATGIAQEHGLQGTYVDAEDGELGNNPIEHGSVDSVISFKRMFAPGEKSECFYWICVGSAFSEVEKLNSFVQIETPERLIKDTGKHWKKWANITPFKFPKLSEQVIDLFKRSLMIVNAHIDKNGAVIASSDSSILYLHKDTYAYMWPRDGALIARSLDRAGYQKITEQFFSFICNAITPEGYLFHKYRPDGSKGSSWHSWLKKGQLQLPIQEDQIALILDALWKHFEQHNNKEYIKNIFDCLIKKLSDFLFSFIDKKTDLPKESYDLWEEKLGVHTFTAAAVYAGLRAATQFESIFGTTARVKKFKKASDALQRAIVDYLYDEEKKTFIKGLYYDDDELKRDETIDASSVYGVYQFGVLDKFDERVVSGFENFKEKLYCKTDVGGYARYVNDQYHKTNANVPGNPWFITTLWLAEYYISIANSEEELQPARDIFEWVVRHACSTGILAEQLNPHTGNPLSVAPLTWSHASFIIAVNKYLEKLDALGLCEMCNPPKFGINKKLKKNNSKKNKKL